MRTTLDLPDDLFRRAKAKAAMKGATLKDLLTRYVEAGLKQPDAAFDRSSKRSKLPVIRRRGRTPISNVTSAIQAKLEKEADLAKLRRSFGR